MASQRKKRAPNDDSKKTLAQLRRKLWKLISRKLLESYRNEDGSITCYTCEQDFVGRQIGMGHGWPKKKYGGTYYDERNLRPQCSRCNLVGQGEQWIYFNKLKAEIGEAEFEDMCEWRHDTRPDRKDWYRREIRRWENG
jgi:hypothetical protein